MPSFLVDENLPIYSQSSGVVHLDPAGQYSLSNDKANGHAPHPPPSSQPSNDSFEDESSTHSTHTSEDSEHSRSQTNWDVSRPSSMTALPNGTNGGGINGKGYQEPEGEKEQRNGYNMTLVDRTLPQRPVINGIKELAECIPNPKEPNPRDSFGSGTAASIQQSPIEMYMQPVNKADVRTVDTTGPSNSPLSPATPTSDPVRRAPSSPHRFSSPPSYPGAGTGASVSNAPQPPPGAGLKHRHTLEVPKANPARPSRDGSDAAFSSGRFSPTTATATARRASLSLARRNTRSLHSDLPRDEIVPDEDALRWAEAYRQKRASKRKRREIEDDDRVLVGTKVDETHANWATAYNMLTGIRVSVSRTNAKLDRPLTDADFHTKQKSTFDVAGNELVPSAKYDFKFKDYAPWVFRHLRALFRLDPADYLMSLTGKYILSELGSPGKSGSFFYFSRDYKYIIKTIHHAEHKFLRKILKDYYQHVTDNPNTLLSQFYGLHRVKMPYGKKIHFVVMNNLFPPHRDIHQTFDLKGSTVGRDYRQDDSATNPRATLKDLNWLRRKRHLELGLQKKQMFLEQLHKDVRLLQRLQIMDYSLLVGIHDLRKGNEENLRDKTLRVFNPGGDVPEDFDPHSVLMRTPSKLENQRKARELRQMIKTERPIPMGETSSRMPDELADGNRSGFLFNQDDGGFRATHEDNSPGEEVYYLGVIDCLTHYGIIKKLEHFWKGLSNDRTQISALPPQDYGERFINFISGITLSPEEAGREAQARDAALAAQAAAAEAEGRERVASWGSSSRRRSSIAHVPPSPNYQPPPPPTAAGMPSEIDSTMHKAEQEARKTEKHGATEADVPDRILKTASTAAVVGASSLARHGQAPSSPAAERKDPIPSQTAILPVVEEAAEGASTGGRSRHSHISSIRTESDGRPLTPAKDGEEMQPGFGNPLLGGHGSLSKGRGPPTPPKTAGHGAFLKPESADSGYGVTGASTALVGGLKSATGSQKSLGVRPQISRDSLDKALPPLPKGEPSPSRSGS
ncbi:SAICAR synthase-like protein [Thozetella sp. PMI_491]|nr:SAICAR synthase-like protein [Thozetella sp. PMI_491]